MGIKAYPSITHVAESIDLAIIIVGRKYVLSSLKQCIEKRVTAAIIITAGFQEADDEGRALEREITQLARESGIKIFTALAEVTAAATPVVTSPNMALGHVMEIGPKMRSADTAVHTTAFSPEAPRLAPAFNIWAVAMALVPRAISSIDSPKASFRYFIKMDPIPPPWPSMTHIFVRMSQQHPAFPFRLVPPKKNERPRQPPRGRPSAVFAAFVA